MKWKGNFKMSKLYAVLCFNNYKSFQYMCDDKEIINRLKKDGLLIESVYEIDAKLINIDGIENEQ